MKNNLLEILCCPSCKENLKLAIEIGDNENISKGSLLCNSCRKKYLIHEGIPRLHISDNEIITISNKSKFPEFIITHESLSDLTKTNKLINTRTFLTNKQITTFLIVCGWFPLFFSFYILISSFINPDFMISDKAQLFVLLILISFLFFFVDYLTYRKIAKLQYVDQLHKLMQLSSINRLSEYDSRTYIKDKKEEYPKSHFPKSKKICSILNKYDFKGTKALHIGCGGELHRSVSEPYFNKGYNMLGVDIYEEYLKEYKQIFNTDVIQANSMALPLRNEVFELVNFTDILEHLHHPFLGLCEAQRVLKGGGVIILSTPYRCRVSFRCANPLVFIERLISLYYDRILPPRTILSQFQNMSYYHIQFSRNEITRLLKAAGFDILSFETYFAKRENLSKIFNKLPFLRFMGPDIMIVGLKKMVHPREIC